MAKLFSLYSASFRQAPLVKTPPSFPIPGDLANVSWRPLPPYMGETFTSMCKFWLIILDMDWLYYSSDSSLSLSDAESIYQRMLAWADALPGELRRSTETTHHATIMHIWYHTLVIDLFSPFLNLEGQQRLASFASADSRPHAVIAASVRQLKHLVYMYRSRFDRATSSILWHAGMLYILNSILRSCPQVEAQFYFLLCMRGYQRLASCIPMAEGIVRSILSIAVREDVMLPADAKKLFAEINKETERLRVVGRKEFASAYPVDLALAAEDAHAGSLEELSRNFEAVTLVDGIKGKKASSMTWTDGVAPSTTLYDDDDLYGRLHPRHN